MQTTQRWFPVDNPPSARWLAMKDKLGAPIVRERDGQQEALFETVQLPALVDLFGAQQSYVENCERMAEVIPSVYRLL